MSLSFEVLVQAEGQMEAMGMLHEDYLCLTNSRKCEERCIAGIGIENLVGEARIQP